MEKVVLNRRIAEFEPGEHEVTKERANYWRCIGALDEDDQKQGLDEPKTPKKPKRKAKTKKTQKSAENKPKIIDDDF